MAELEEAGWSKSQEKPKEELTNKVSFQTLNIAMYRVNQNLLNSAWRYLKNH